MSFTGVCQVCEAAEARHSCEQCGALVCDDHFDRDHALCTNCAASLRGRDDATPGDDFDVMR